MGEIFEQVASFNNLFISFKKAFKGKKKDPDASFFFLNLEDNLFRIREELLERKYEPGQYRYFSIKFPKERIISVAPFKDRVVHHALVQIIEPIFEKCFIETSFACRKGKGTHRAVLLAQEFLKRYHYYLKMDVEKYFETLDHEKFMEIFSEEIEDRDVLWLAKRILRISEESSGCKGKGIPIGNLTSQFFANVFLNTLDHFLINECGIQRYIRYMDDFVIFDNSKEKLKGIRERIRYFLKENLSLKLKEKATYIQKRENGLSFIGYRIYPNLIRLKNQNVRRLKKKVLMQEKEFIGSEIGEDKYMASVQSILGYFQFANSRNLLKSIFLNRERTEAAPTG